MTKRIAAIVVLIALGVAAVFAVSYAQSGQQLRLEAERARQQQRAQAASQIRTANTYSQSTPTTEIPSNGCFVIYPYPYEGYRFLLDRCTGDSWYFDDGYDLNYENPGEGGQNRPQTWRRIRKEE